jgi:hypothetical protein
VRRTLARIDGFIYGLDEMIRAIHPSLTETAYAAGGFAWLKPMVGDRRSANVPALAGRLAG